MFTKKTLLSTFIHLSVQALSVILLNACSNYSHLPNVVPTSERDRMPVNPKDVSLVGDAVPKYEMRTAAGNSSPYKIMGKVYYVNSKPEGYREKGTASWYGEKFHGRRTASGEVYDMYAMTAAHPSLPIPSYVRVTNLNNYRSVIVRINDRGPFHPGRVIDLSYAGAYKLGYIQQGTAPVSVEYIDTSGFSPPSHAISQTTGLNRVSSVVNDTTGSGAKLYYQFGAFSTHDGAQKMSQDLKRRTTLPVNIVSEVSHTSITSAPKALHKVHLGPVQTTKDKNEVKRLLDRSAMPKPLEVYR